MITLLCFIIIVMAHFTQALVPESTELELKSFLQNDYETMLSKLCYKANSAEYDYEIDINNKTKSETAVNVTIENSNIEKGIWEKHFKGLNVDQFKDPLIKRQLKFLSVIGIAILEPKDLEKLTNITNEMTNIYGTAKICPYKKQNCNISSEGLTLEPEIEEIMKRSTDYDELLYIWKAWRDASGAKMKNIYKTYVSLSNQASRMNNFSDYGELWRYPFEDPNFIENMDYLWKQVEPLYRELHTYVANKLKITYGDKLDISDGLIPAHIFGNLWAQEWQNIAHLVKPFPKANKIDIDSALKEQNYTIFDLYSTADEFYQSLGLLPNGMSYNESAGAMIEKPTDGRDVLCHAAAWDFCDAKTFKIKMCTKVSFEDFLTIHHEMGHIQYFQLYKNQPYTFRDGANPGFHEAIGDTMALSVATPKHLAKIGLLKEYEDNREVQLNTLMDMALSKIAFLPFGLIIDKWRWEVFNNSIPTEKWNSRWWFYRMKYQQIKAPVIRSENDFDPAAKYHVAADVPYISYFLALILQFQFFKSLCMIAGEYHPSNQSAPLHECDFYQSKSAGNVLRTGLSLGSSRHWSETLKILTGTTKVDAQPMLEYFQPLYEYLIQENKKAEIVTEPEMEHESTTNQADTTTDYVDYNVESTTIADDYLDETTTQTDNPIEISTTLQEVI